MNKHDVVEGRSSHSSLEITTGASHASKPDGDWRDSIATADVALENATRIQGVLQQNLRLLHEVSELRDALQDAYTRLERYAGMHDDALAATKQVEAERAAERERDLHEMEQLSIRHRTHKLLGEYYALTVLGLDAPSYAKHHECVLHHVQFQHRRGVSVAQVQVKDISRLLCGLPNVVEVRPVSRQGVD